MKLSRSGDLRGLPLPGRNSPHRLTRFSVVRWKLRIDVLDRSATNLFIQGIAQSVEHSVWGGKAAGSIPVTLIMSICSRHQKYVADCKSCNIKIDYEPPAKLTICVKCEFEYYDVVELNKTCPLCRNTN